MRVCTFLQYPSTSIEVGIAGFPPPPPPPPPAQILKSFLRILAKQQFLGHRLKHKIILLLFLKVRKDAKISNRYTQVPHLTQDTPSGSDKTQ